MSLWPTWRSLVGTFRLNQCGLLVTAFLVSGGSAYAAERTSPNFTVTFEAITAGGGPGASAQFVQNYSAIGQMVAVGSSASSRFREVSGFVPAAHFVPVRLSGLSLE